MPELVLLCGREEFACTAITVKTYRKYTEIMERNTTVSVKDAYEANLQILSEIFGVPRRKIMAADAESILETSKEAHFLAQEVVTKKFLDLNPAHPERVEQEKSAFDEYDEENGYNDEVQEEENFWKICRENTDRLVKMCIQVMKNSYKECMESDIMSLLDYAAFEIRTAKEN